MCIYLIGLSKMVTILKIEQNLIGPMLLNSFIYGASLII